MQEIHSFLQSIHKISEDDFSLLTNSFKLKKFKKGEHLIVPGQIQTKMFFVKKGLLMYHFDFNEKTNILGFATNPNFCAIPESFFYQKPATYYLSCLEDSELEYISFEQLQRLFEQSQQIERLFRKISEAVIVGLLNRQIELRSTTIEERFKAFCQRSPHLVQRIPHKYLASYLAIDPTNFSKLFNSVKF